jgi:TRAP-type C4-dicarboxylate transport system substrate-binding protein
MSNHNLSIVPLFGSKRKLDALPPALLKILRDEIRASVPRWRSATADQLTKDLEFIKSNGAEFTEIQTSAFRKAVEPVYAMVQSKIGGDLLERVNRAAGNH